jgi:Tfp pilus assembly protein PilE
MSAPRQAEGLPAPALASRRTDHAAFSLVEIVIILAILGVVSTTAYVTLRGVLIRSRLSGTAQQLAMMAVRARLEGVKLGTASVVAFDAAGTVEAFADANTASGAAGSDRIYNPEASSTASRDRRVELLHLPEGTFFGGPQQGPPKNRKAFDGLSPGPTSGGPPVLLISPVGAVVDAGAVRLGDPYGNFLEVRFAGALARAEIRKWVDSEGAWFLRDERPWEWQTEMVLP